MIRSTDSQTDTSHISTNRIRINDKYSLNTCVTTYFLRVSSVLKHKNDSGTFKLTQNFELPQQQRSQTSNKSFEQRFQSSIFKMTVKMNDETHTIPSFTLGFSK